MHFITFKQYDKQLSVIKYKHKINIKKHLRNYLKK